MDTSFVSVRRDRHPDLNEITCATLGRPRLLHVGLHRGLALGLRRVQSKRGMLTSRTSARLPVFALALTLANQRRLRSSSSSAAESECTRLSAWPSITSEPRRSGAFERFHAGVSLGVAGLSRSNSSAQKTACRETLLRRGAPISRYWKTKPRRV
jgi:hypothetical protein